jgi:uracil-DNA glycosylase family 4
MKRKAEDLKKELEFEAATTPRKSPHTFPQKTPRGSRKERYSLHVSTWKTCTRCYLYECRSKVVLCRGKLPCDVLFVGEAPGESEDVLGQPFVGPAGHLLDGIISRGLPGGTRAAFTNLIGCIPRDGEGGKLAAPSDESVKACSPRLVEFVGIASPRVVVCVGSEAWDWLDPEYKHRIPVSNVPLIKIVHPAAVLRANVAQRGLMVQRCVVTLRNMAEEYLGA